MTRFCSSISTNPQACCSKSGAIVNIAMFDATRKTALYKRINGYHSELERNYDDLQMVQVIAD